MTMLRLTIALLVATVFCETALGADRPVVHRGWRYAARQLPAGLPRPHYNFRTTISYGAPYPYRRKFYAYARPAVLVMPVFVPVPYVPVLFGAPVVPYEYNYWDRPPYACGVYGYC
jgi:hypothetical protein